MDQQLLGRTPAFLCRWNALKSPVHGSATLTAEQEQQLAAGDLYVNVHTNNYRVVRSGDSWRRSHSGALLAVLDKTPRSLTVLTPYHPSMSLARVFGWARTAARPEVDFCTVRDGEVAGTTYLPFEQCGSPERVTPSMQARLGRLRFRVPMAVPGYERPTWSRQLSPPSYRIARSPACSRPWPGRPLPQRRAHVQVVPGSQSAASTTSRSGWAGADRHIRGASRTARPDAASAPCPLSVDSHCAGTRDDH